jgi:hypothetical protein
MVTRQQAVSLWTGRHGAQELGGDLPFQKPISVLGEARMIPGGIVHAQPDEPAVQEIAGRVQLPFDDEFGRTPLGVPWAYGRSKPHAIEDFVAATVP